MSKELTDENLKLTIIGTDMELTGDLYTSNDVRVDGKFLGNMHSSGKIVVSKHGSMKGNINGINVVIMGSAEGKFIIENNFQILSEGSFKGSVKTRYLHIADKAYFDGTCDISPNHEAIQIEQPSRRIDVKSLEEKLHAQSAQTIIDIQNKFEEDLEVKKETKIEIETVAEEKQVDLPKQELPELNEENEIKKSEADTIIPIEEEKDETPITARSILSSKISQIKPL